jgi:hypothetical protein
MSRWGTRRGIHVDRSSSTWRTPVNTDDELLRATKRLFDGACEFSRHELLLGREAA